MGRKAKLIAYVDGQPVRTCGRCDEQKPIYKFYNCGSNASGLDYYCKPCRKRKITPKKKHCDECGADCDGTLQMGTVTRCSACFDKIVYGENPTQWSLPQRSSMLL